MSCIVVKHRKKAAAPFLFESLSYFLTNIHDRWHDNWSIFLVYSLGLGWGAPSGSCNSWLSTVLASQVDCSQPSIFSYFNSMVESADRITWKLVASAKPKTWLGRGWRAGFFFLSSLASPTPPPTPHPPPHPRMLCVFFCVRGCEQFTSQDSFCKTVQVLRKSEMQIWKVLPYNFDHKAQTHSTAINYLESMKLSET